MRTLLFSALLALAAATVIPAEEGKVDTSENHRAAETEKEQQEKGAEQKLKPKRDHSEEEEDNSEESESEEGSEGEQGHEGKREKRSEKENLGGKGKGNANEKGKGEGKGKGREGVEGHGKGKGKGYKSERCSSLFVWSLVIPYRAVVVTEQAEIPSPRATFNGACMCMPLYINVIQFAVSA
ncbi:hypothetical protein NDU88_000436 [Pleurodeles waltl]|uniref:Uncharacterized protein n=1 Tax=Pleurodeles waltl TaxID=8319 RepID=A0AAV7P0V6_PLEWA|nr:hypothetical protein NDU88_000436 [Pleurodeles waltl]